jgi:hypothetical protein
MGLREIVHSRTGAVVAGAAVLVTIGGVGGAVAAAKITSSDIKNQTIKKIDIGANAVGSSELVNGSIAPRDLSDAAKRGMKGEKGDQGEPGQDGADGTATYAGPNWSLVDRNVIGNGDAYLRSGPFSENFGVSVAPPLGDGSLGLRTGSGGDKVAFGNQVDFVGDPVQALTALRYSIYTTGENGEGNLPNLQFEIDPNLDGVTSDFSTLGFVPDAIPANKWTDVDAASDTTGFWFLTGAAGTATNCTQATECTWTEVKAALDDGAPDATIHTAQINKGRDSEFVGAVDKLVINGSTFDFEPFGVTETTN